MSTVGTFGGFTAARLGIYASQKALEVTGNNISNINTPGYTRQRLDQLSLKVGASDRYHAKYDTQVGQGVLTVSVSQLRDPYLDIRYRAESATMGFTETTQTWLSDVQAILDEVGDGDDEHGVIYAQLEQIETALRSHSDFAGEKEYNTQVRNACEALIFKINEAARKLNTTKTNAVASLEEQVEGVNDILTQIRDLNIQIRKSDIHGDNALEMRDKRNVLIDQLSTYMDIDVIYTEESFGPGAMVEKLTIKLGNANPDPAVSSDEALLVDGAYCTQFALDKTPDLNPKFKTYERQDWYKQLADDPANKTNLDNLDKEIEAMRDAYEALNKYLNSPDNVNDKGEPLDPADPKYVALEKAASDAKDAVKTRLNVLNVKFGDETGAVVDVNDAGELYPTDTNIPEAERFGFLNKKGEPVKTRQEAEMVYDEHYTLTISELRDKNDKIFQVKKEDGAGGFYYVDSQPVSLDDNDLYGAVQALREFLTEEGEFASGDEIAELDENAATKRGIPYFQKSLDLLARKFAETFNEANQDFLCNEEGNYIDQDGNEIICPDFDANGEPIYKTDGAGLVFYKDANGNEYTPVAANQYQDKAGKIYTFDSEKETMTPAVGEPITVSGVPKPGTETKMNKYAPLTDEQKEWLAQEAAKGVDENGNPKLDADGKPVKGYPVAMGGVLFSNAGDSDDPNYITAENISISMSWASEATRIVRSFVQPSKLANMEEGTQGTEGKPGEDSVASTDNLNILHMLSLLDKTMTYNPQDWTDEYGNPGNASSPVLVKADFNEMFNNIGTVLGNDMRNANIKYDTTNVSLTDLDMARDAVSAVDLNDEAMNLMQFSKSYSAACRLMTTLDDVLDRLINNTGVTR